MIIDLNAIKRVDAISADICIIGAGPAGIAVAKKLCELNRQIDICLLESGGFEFEPDTQQLYSGSSVGQRYFPLQSTRLRFFGGSTGHWEGWCAPLNEIDFVNRPWMRDSGWPISFDALSPHYEWSHNFFNLGSPYYQSDFWKREVDSFPPFDPTKLVGRAWQFSSPPMRVGDHYRKYVAESAQITAYLHANATNIDVSVSGDSIKSISVSNLDRTRRTKISANSYVLACGGIENPRLLLSSNDVLPKGIGNKNGIVGRYFHDHINVSCAELYGGNIHSLEQYQHFIVDGRLAMGIGYCPSFSIQKKYEIGNLAAYLRLGASFRRSKARQSLARIKHSVGAGGLPDSLLTDVYTILKNFDGIAAHTAIQLRHWFDGDQPARINYGTVSVLSEQMPNYDSRIYLSDEKDALGMRTPIVDWQLSPIDHRTIRESMLNLASEFAQLGMGRIKLEHWLESQSPKWPDRIIAGHHPMGTTRMSNDVTKGVVDSDCKVHGIANLYIIGSSVFPTGGYANPTLSIVALASRLGDHIIKRRFYG